MKETYLLLLFCLSVRILPAQSDYREAVPESQREDSLMQALEHIPAFTIYKDNYIITGTNFEKGRVTKYNSDAKFQISLRHRLFRKLLPYRLYTFLTYTQKSFWDIYRKSAPFTETTYNPTLGLGRNFIRNRRIEWIGMVQFEHESNGRDGIYSRSWNYLSLTAIYLPGKRLNLQAKTWLAMMVAKQNKRLTRYAGIGHFAATYVSANKRFNCSALMIKRGGWNLNANWQVGVAYRLFREDNQFLYLQFYNGYGESMIDYNHFQRCLRVGFVIKPNSVSIF